MGRQQDITNPASRPRAGAFDRQVGGHLRALRLAQSLSQTELAALLGVTFQQVQKYERGANRLPLEKLCRLRAVFGLSLDCFLAPVCDTVPAGGKKNA